MKRIFAIFIAACLILTTLRAQDEADAMRYSQNFYGGTARSMSMGGAFGALGGDFTSASLNPAGIGVYRSSEITFTPTILFDNTTSNYLGKTTGDNQYRFMLNNLGFVHTRLTGKDQGWAGVTFGVGYNQLNSFNRNTMMSSIQLSGGAESSSLLDNFTNNANAGVWSDFYEQLAWDANLMPYDSLAGEYWNDIRDAGYGQFQRRRIQESGGLGEFVFTMGANYSNKLYVGATFGIHRLNYTGYTDHTEMDDAGIIPYFDSFTFRETLETRGTGYAFKVGVIYRPISLIRLGLAFHLPTFYRIKEDFYTDMSSTFDAETGEPDYFESSPYNQFDYWLRTPYRAIGSAAVQLGKLAIISADYEFTDYRQANFDSRGTDYGLLDQNDRIRAICKTASNLRTGSEVHLGPMYLRAGASFYDSPYRSILENGKNSDAWNIVMSGGLGFRSEKVFFDLSYARRVSEYQYWLYIPEDARGAIISSHNEQMAATLGFRF
jgi:hypothetical protein